MSLETVLERRVELKGLFLKFSHLMGMILDPMRLPSPSVTPCLTVIGIRNVFAIEGGGLVEARPAAQASAILRRAKGPVSVSAKKFRLCEFDRGAASAMGD